MASIHDDMRYDSRSSSGFSMPDAVTIYHNPDCGTSRNALALIRASGIEPTIIEYLRNPPDEATLRSLVARTGLALRDLVRSKGTPYRDLRLDSSEISDDTLMEYMLRHPILINRPLVVSSRGVRLCRPSDLVLDLLPPFEMPELLKQDGTPVLRGTPVAGEDPGLRAALLDAGLPVDDLLEPGREFFAYAMLDGVCVGYGGYEPYGRDMLLRSLVVLPSRRDRGIGAGMLALLLRRAFDEGVRTAWLLTTDAAPFFEKAGFRRVERGGAPARILGSRQATMLCPASAVLLARSVEP